MLHLQRRRPDQRVVAVAVVTGSRGRIGREVVRALAVDADGRPYKGCFGMASARAVSARTAGESAYEQARKALFEEGISSGRMYLDPRRPGVEDILDTIAARVRSACTYASAANLAEFHERAVIGAQTRRGTPGASPSPAPEAVLLPDRAGHRPGMERGSKYRTPPELRAELEGLPADRTFATVYEIWEALGHRNATRP